MGGQTPRSSPANPNLPPLPLYAGAPDGARRCFDDGRLALDNNPAERALRCVAIGRKNYFFAGSDAGGRRAAALYSLIETAKLNGLDPQHYLADVLTRIADHPARAIADLLPWNWQPAEPDRAADPSVFAERLLPMRRGDEYLEAPPRDAAGQVQSGGRAAGSCDPSAL